MAQQWEKVIVFVFPATTWSYVICKGNHLTIVLGKIKIWNVIYVFLSMARAALSIHLHRFGNVDLICNESVRNLACGKVTVDGGKITSRQKSSRRQTFCFLLNKSHCRLYCFSKSFCWKGGKWKLAKCIVTKWMSTADLERDCRPWSFCL